MNWMIDGVHGDLYRATMGYQQLQRATDEWDIERRVGRSPRGVGYPFAGLIRPITANLAHARETIGLALTSKKTAS